MFEMIGPLTMAEIPVNARIIGEKTTTVHARIAQSTLTIAQAHARRMHLSDAAYYRLAIETLNGIQSGKSRVAGPEIVE